MQVTVTQAPARHRYEARVSGELVGFLAYIDDGAVLDLVHTEVDDEVSGRGVGSALVGSALDHIRGQGRRVRPSCPFVARWIHAHQDYADLVATGEAAGR